MPLENIFRSEFFTAVRTFHRIRLTAMGKHMPFEAEIATTVAMKPFFFS